MQQLQLTTFINVSGSVGTADAGFIGFSHEWVHLYKMGERRATKHAALVYCWIRGILSLMVE